MSKCRQRCLTDSLNSQGWVQMVQVVHSAIYFKIIFCLHALSPTYFPLGTVPQCLSDQGDKETLVCKVGARFLNEAQWWS